MSQTPEKDAGPIDIESTKIPYLFELLDHDEKNRTIVYDGKGFLDPDDMWENSDGCYHTAEFSAQVTKVQDEDPLIDIKVLRKCIKDKKAIVMVYKNFDRYDVIGFKVFLRVSGIGHFPDRIYYVRLHVWDSLSPNRWFNLPMELDQCEYDVYVDLEYSSKPELLDPD